MSAKGAMECCFVNAVKYKCTVSMLKVRGSVVLSMLSSINVL